MVTFFVSVAVTLVATEPQFLYYLIFSISRSASLVVKSHVSSIVSSTQLQCVWDPSSLDFVCLLKRKERRVFFFFLPNKNVFMCFRPNMLGTAMEWTITK